MNKPDKTTLRTPPPSVGTRERVLEVAHAMISEQGSAGITLVDVAARAGVSRQTLYLLFKNRAGMLLALVDSMDASSTAPQRLTELRQTLPPELALEPYVRTWLDYLQVVYPVALALSAAAATGDRDAEAAFGSRMEKLRGGFNLLTRGLRDAGHLHNEWTPKEAADYMFSLTHVDMWYHLVRECGWTPKMAVNRIVAVILELLLNKEAEVKRPRRDGARNRKARTRN